MKSKIGKIFPALLFELLQQTKVTQWVRVCERVKAVFSAYLSMMGANLQPRYTPITTSQLLYLNFRLINYYILTVAPNTAALRILVLQLLQKLDVLRNGVILHSANDF